MRQRAASPDNAVLTLIMTAPMVVRNWINLRYHASTVDNHRYGSGNKLHLFWLEPLGKRVAQCWRGKWLEVLPNVEVPTPAV